MKTQFAMLLAGAMLAAGATSASAATSTVQAPTGFFVPTDAQKFDAPYYRGAGQDWSWQHAAYAGSFTTASLNISAFDVDSCCGELDMIDVDDNGVWVNVGSLTGTNNAWDFGNSFSLGAQFFDDIATGLKVRIRIDENNQGWFVTLGKSVITFDGSGPGNPNPGVPEPSTWAMLIAGFGLVGAMARRRREASVTA